jgi:hypothetical protein
MGLRWDNQLPCRWRGGSCEGDVTVVMMWLQVMMVMAMAMAMVKVGDV